MSNQSSPWSKIPIQQLLILTTLLLLGFGLVMVASSSIPFAEKNENLVYYHYVMRQGIYALFGGTLAFLLTKVPIRYFFKPTVPISLWIIALVLLGVTFLFPPINGSIRWISLGGIKFQSSELVKLIMLIFTADYVVRRSDEVRFEWMGFLRLCIPMVMVLVFIMMQPDLGASVVIAGSMMAVFFLAGAPLRQFVLMFVAAAGAVTAAILTEPYRLNRVKTLIDPWKDEWGAGFQLTRSLMAVGRGEWAGVGFGQSVFKLAHLPEAHTDFIAAIIGEELGFFGLAFIILLEGLLVFCAIYIGQTALKKQKMREGYLAYGIACVFIIQIFVNIGMNIGLLPTKGLTLPLVSYGGSSLVVVLMMIGILYRISYESSQIQTTAKRYY